MSPGAPSPTVFSLQRSTINKQHAWGRVYRRVLPAAYLDMFYLIFLDCELSASRGLDCSIVSLRSETGCLWLYSQSDIKHMEGVTATLKTRHVRCGYSAAPEINVRNWVVQMIEPNPRPEHACKTLIESRKVFRKSSFPFLGFISERFEDLWYGLSLQWGDKTVSILYSSLHVMGLLPSKVQGHSELLSFLNFSLLRLLFENMYLHRRSVLMYVDASDLPGYK